MSSVPGNFRLSFVVCGQRTETAAEMVKTLMKEIVPKFGLPGSLQSDNDLVFVSEVTEGIMNVLA